VRDTNAQVVRIGKKEYKLLKAFAKEHGQMITFVLNQAVQAYLASQGVNRK
jgi:hypothetical protein